MHIFTRIPYRHIALVALRPACRVTLNFPRTFALITGWRERKRRPERFANDYTIIYPSCGHREKPRTSGARLFAIGAILCVAADLKVFTEFRVCLARVLGVKGRQTIYGRVSVRFRL